MHPNIPDFIERLRSAEVRDVLITTASIEGVRARLRRSDTFRKLYAQRLHLTRKVVDSAVEHLLASFEPGVNLAEEPALCLLLTLAEELPSSVAGHVLEEVAELHVSELFTAHRLAKLCLRKRAQRHDRPLAEQLDMSWSELAQREHTGSRIRPALPEVPAAPAVAGWGLHHINTHDDNHEHTEDAQPAVGHHAFVISEAA